MTLTLAPAAAFATEAKARPAGLELRIVANDTDDRAALAAVKKKLAAIRKNARRRKELQRLAREGQPPTPPRPPDGKAFATPLGKFTYSWVELGPAELRHLNLTADAAKDPKRNALWKKVAKAHERGEAIMVPSGYLLYSRECQNRHLSRAERKQKGFDYFVLLRDPAAGKAITAKHLVNAEEGKDSVGRPLLKFTLSKKGGKLLNELTTKNKPAGGKNSFRRRLAVVLGNRVVGAYAIRDPIGAKGQISGNFSREEMAAMAKALRGTIGRRGE
jgi:hypothetical protein